MIDVDRLKQVNDRFGHTAGTQLLRMVAAAIGGCARSSDVLARYGGDEFAVPMPHARSETARIAAERIRHAIHVAAFEMNGHAIAPSASIGIAAIPESGAAAADVMEQADIALYQSKQSGRDGSPSIASLPPR